MLILKRLNRPGDKCVRDQRGESMRGGGEGEHCGGHELENHQMATRHSCEETLLVGQILEPQQQQQKEV